MLHSEPEAPWDLLAKHLAGEAAPDELEQLRTWVAADPKRLGLLTDATRAWERTGAVPVADLFSAADVEAAWQRFRPKMTGPAPAAEPPLRVVRAAPAVETGAAPEAKVIPLRPNPLPSLLRIAATILLLIGAVYAMQNYRRELLPTPPVAVSAGPQKRLVALPDGSKVWLNKHSTLEYAADFSGGSGREVTLTGEAFFEVQKDPENPFTVLSAASRTRVLGTSFNVRAYAAEDSVEVSVVTGKVAFASRSSHQDSVLLTPGMRGVLLTAGPTNTPVPVRQTASADANFRAWQTDELAFDNATLAHVIRTLRTTFGTTITVADKSLLKCRFTGTFRQPDPIQVLQVVSVATNATLSGDAADGFILGGQGCE
ncbi:FecR family protein [Hymenobacter chitinivorans]|uniref:Ferric-dicitrate binding protein FerR (Iron transport regulator) n=1 Tax=Hymenobacter chitinivorans DSM 11115 TaxID=1121954 RepID=A0A2M9AST8_9BACT|nr:FecR domain-containing protein [Hymenobacter chitinivorans]PJJ48781.1 ferric-dicitrate binding protein FerR (iron transport regulator) [Hymenobacter chitinivorans DSM 11115]